MATRSKVTKIIDRYELAIVIMHRNGSDLGKPYMFVTHASKKRIARLVTTMFEQKRLSCHSYQNNKDVYVYKVKA